MCDTPKTKPVKETPPAVLRNPFLDKLGIPATKGRGDVRIDRGAASAAYVNPYARDMSIPTQPGLTVPGAVVAPANSPVKSR